MNLMTRIVRAPDGRELCVEIGGEPRDHSILVHNGMPNSRHIYRPWIEDAQARGAQLISYDRPGYGGSTRQPGHTVADAAADVRAIAEDLGIKRLFVWGLSGGGPPTLACAALLPDLVPAVGVVASPAPWGASDLDYFEGMGEDNVHEIKLYLDDPNAARAQGAKLRKELLAATPQTLAEAWKSLLSEADAAVVTAEFAEFIVHCIQDGLATTHEGWADDGESQMEPWGFELESIRVPVKLWHGRHDRFVPFQHGQWLAAHVPGIQANLSESDGHLTLLANRVPEVHDWLLAHV